MIGASVGPYVVLKEIGSGGMGEVYLAQDERLGRKVALKSLSGQDVSSPTTRKRLLHEARIAAKLNHPNIAAIYDVIEAKERSCIVMEYVEGETLADRMKRGRVPPDEVLRIGLQICNALMEAHSHGVIHRDLKPANIRLTPEGKVKVLDFGLAKVKELEIGGSRTATLSTASAIEAAKMVGTPAYMPPEQLLAKDVDQRSDIYSAGVVLFELLAERRPFEGANVLDLAMAVLTKPTPEIIQIDPSLPAELNAIVARAMAREPRDRHPSAGELRRDLSRLLPQASESTVEDLKGTPPTVTTLRSFPAKRSWNRRTAFITGAALLVMLAFLVYLNPWRERRPPSGAGRSPIVIVLPFVNLSGDPSKDHISAGVADSLTIALARLPTLRLLSGGVVEDYVRRRGRNPTRIAKDLDATMVVDGGVQESGGRIHITASLIRPDGSIEWPYEDVAALSEIFNLQARLAEGMGAHLESKISEASRRLLAQPLTNSLESFQEYSRGRAYMERRDISGNLPLAIKSFERAIDRDRKFAEAYAGLGEACWRQYQETKQPQWIEKAKEAIYEALRLDPERSEVRISLAQLLNGTGRPDDALAELRRVIQVQPNNDDAHRQIGEILTDKAQFEAGVNEIVEAIKLRPGFWENHRALANAYYIAGRLEDAARSYQRLTELQPDNAWAFGNLGATYMALGDNRHALESLEKSIAITPDAYTYANIGTVQYWEGEYGKAAIAYQEAIKLLPNEAWIHRNLGDAYTRLGRRQGAVASYTEAVRLSEELLRVNPNDAEELGKNAVYQAKLGRREEAKRRALQACNLRPADKDVLYSKAVVHCLSGEYDEALAMLKLSLKHGYSQVEMKKDDDLAPLKPLPAFQALVAAKP